MCYGMNCSFENYYGQCSIPGKKKAWDSKCYAWEEEVRNAILEEDKEDEIEEEEEDNGKQYADTDE